MDKLHDLIIVGSGISGLGAAHFLLKKKPGSDILLLEKAARPGGAIRSFSQQGFLAEWGPHGFLDNVEASRELLSDTGLDQESQKAPLGDFVRYICLNGRLVMIPQSPLKIIASSLLPLSKKLRVLADLWKKPRPGEQSVGDWAAYRFGKGVLPFVDAVFTGTYAGDFARLSIDAVMPGIRCLELESGSVLRGLLNKRKKDKAARPGPGRTGLPAMVSFPQGMERLTDRLAADKNIIFNCAVDRIEKRQNVWQVKAGGRTFSARALLLALSVNQSLAIISASAIPLQKKPPLPRLAEAAMANVVLGFSDRVKIPFGFGYLAPEQEKRFALGALFSSHIFPGRAPAGKVLIEVLVGGRRHPERLTLADDLLVENILNDIGQLLDLSEPPCFIRVLRPAGGIPQLEMGYPELLNWRGSLVAANRGLHLCGFGWGGIGINDMTRGARAVAGAIAKGGGDQGATTEVKGVYF